MNWRKLLPESDAADRKVYRMMAIVGTACSVVIGVVFYLAVRGAA